MVERQFSPDQYPDALLRGDVLATAFRGLQAQLKAAFPDAVFAHHVLPPSPTPQLWKRVQEKQLSVALSMGSWMPDSKSGKVFRGSLTFYVFLLVSHGHMDQLYLGTSDRWGVGITGMSAMAVAMLNRQPVPGLDGGTFQVMGVKYPAGIDWLDERTALAEIAVQIDGVSLSEGLLTHDLPEFLRLAETWTVNGSEQPEATLNIRGDA
ncbi:hypothetical protein [Acetobacter senegalensis]|uniref:hypothetical protein n=1 Tax=Acetobacter senegalensis TaxID=446692 RepID=UPI002652DC63|nr:hypothetical protein [Acetobacter senegalensis]MDN7351764.1 hypothetical protein [Acetobacter senegalensis]